ncbi:hypothetical protein CesoFtcFv8_000157 [Champsocephalus esox]|uniref:Uncharacterized protein n=1 Tax=Champsocephalus esox TaxID=159716 RepID=A0AAN8I4J6_9TELE|nr:hypothetical protein CesoFtcFv8_000157 [Champsocephalus esox]
MDITVRPGEVLHEESNEGKERKRQVFHLAQFLQLLFHLKVSLLLRLLLPTFVYLLFLFCTLPGTSRNENCSSCSGIQIWGQKDWG